MATSKASTCSSVEKGKRWDQFEELVRTLPHYKDDKGLLKLVKIRVKL